MQTTHETLPQIQVNLRDWEVEHKPVDTFGRLSHFFPFVNGGITLKPIRTSDVTSHLKQMQLTQHAEKQFCKIIDFQPNLIKRLSPSLAMGAMFDLIGKEAKDKDVQFRTIDSGTCRAIMSTRYEPFDNLELINLLIPFTEGAIVRWEALNDLSFNVSISFERTKTEVQVGDWVERGIHIRNSEVGMASVTIAGYVFKLRCRNGLITRGRDGEGGFFQFRHISDTDKMNSKVTSAIETCLIESSVAVNRMKEAYKKHLDDTIGYIKELGKKEEMTEDDVNRIMNSWANDSGNTMGHVVDAVTGTANTLEDPEKAYEFQRLGAKLLEGVK